MINPPLPGRIDGSPGWSLLVPAVIDDAPELIKQGQSFQAVVATGQPCPGCGAQAHLNRTQRRQLARKQGPVVVEVWHHPGCPGAPDNLAAALARWGQS